MPEPVREMAVARPGGPLRTVVAAHAGYRDRGVAPARHLGLPSPWLTVIFTLDEPLRVARHPDPQQAPAAYRALVGGLHTAPAVIEHDGAQSGVQLRLDPLGSRALLGMPAGELAGIDVVAADLLGRLGDDLPELLAAAPTWRARFRLLDDRLGRVLVGRTPGGRREPPPEVRRAWRVLRASGGTARVADVAREVGWSERHLAARFRTEIGVSPKTAARVIRFDRARHLVPRLPGATVAATCGYADQSHLVRDFVAFTGLAPGAWLAAEVGNLYAPDDAEARHDTPAAGVVTTGRRPARTPPAAPRARCGGR